MWAVGCRVMLLFVVNVMTSAGLAVLTSDPSDSDWYIEVIGQQQQQQQQQHAICLLVGCIAHVVCLFLYSLCVCLWVLKSGKWYNLYFNNLTHELDS